MVIAYRSGINKHFIIGELHFDSHPFADMLSDAVATFALDLCQQTVVNVRYIYTERLCLNNNAVRPTQSTGQLIECSVHTMTMTHPNW